MNRVQISVNGAQNTKFRDSIELNTLFERNLDYIGESDNQEILEPLERIEEE